MNISALMQKKIGPVPVLYIVGGAVAILAVVAYRMKPSVGTPADEVGEDAALDENGLADGSDPYAGFRTNGTVIVQQPPATATKDRPGSNDEWVRSGAEWLSKSKGVSPTTGYTALMKYLEGKSRSTQEQAWIDAVIGEQGFPPESFPDAPPPVSPAPDSGRGDAPTGSQAPRAVTLVAPSGLRVVNKGRDYISVDINAVSGADGYQFFVDGRQWGRTVVGSDMRITGLRPGTRYSITAAAVNDWNVGPRAPAIAVTTNR